MRILYDGYIYRLQKTGGINRYFQEIIARLPADFRPCIYGRAPSELNRPGRRQLRLARPFPFPSLTSSLAARWASRFDVVHPTYYHLSEPLDYRAIRAPVALTVYDFVFRRYGHLYEKSTKLLAAQKEAIDRADVLLCISRSTMDDLLEFHPGAAGRAMVIPLACPSMPAPSAEAYSTHKKPYFLFVGARSFYKNFALAVRALSIVASTDSEMEMVVAGAPWNESEMKLLREEGLADRVRLLEFPRDEELANLYAGAVCLMYPSEYEGFGLPLLEALSNGTPVVALRASSIPEVAGPGGILIEPREATPETLADAVRQIHDSPSLRQTLVASGRRHLSSFSWERTAAATLRAYTEIAPRAYSSSS